MFLFSSGKAFKDVFYLYTSLLNERWKRVGVLWLRGLEAAEEPLCLLVNSSIWSGPFSQSLVEEK
jgi:hypothetical protein